MLHDQRIKQSISIMSERGRSILVMKIATDGKM